MTAIHFVRHGDVENPKHVYYGRLPGYPLSDTGREQIDYLAHQLKSYPIRAITHSPLLRGEQTAEIINQFFNLPLQSDERLNEINTLFEGKERDLLIKFPPAPNQFAETMSEIYERMADFVQEAAQRYPDQEIVAVSHGGPIHILELGLQNLPFSDWAYEHEAVPGCGTDTLVTVEGTEITVKRMLL